MKVRITAVAVIDIHESEFEEIASLSAVDILEELGNADNVFTSVQPADDDDDERSSECAFCGEPTLPQLS